MWLLVIHGQDPDVISCSGFIIMKFKIPFEKGMKHTMNIIIAHAKHRTIIKYLLVSTNWSKPVALYKKFKIFPWFYFVIFQVSSS